MHSPLAKKVRSDGSLNVSGLAGRLNSCEIKRTQVPRLIQCGSLISCDTSTCFFLYKILWPTLGHLFHSKNTAKPKAWL